MVQGSQVQVTALLTFINSRLKIQDSRFRIWGLAPGWWTAWTEWTAWTKKIFNLESLILNCGLKARSHNIHIKICVGVVFASQPEDYFPVGCTIGDDGTDIIDI